MDPFRYRKAYAAMLHATQLIEDRLNQDANDNEPTGDEETTKAAFQEADPDSMEWEPTESRTPPVECGPPKPLSEKLRQFLPGAGDGDVRAEDGGENAVILHKLKEGIIMDACIDKLVRDLPDVLSHDDVLSFTPSTIEVPKDFGLQLSISINHHLAQVADRKALEKYRRLLGHRKDVSKRKQVRLGFDPVELIKKQAVSFSETISSPVCSLNNDIHNIFRIENWHGCPDAIYQVLKPALQLATLFITSRATAHFWQTLVFGKREPCEETSKLYGQPCYRIRETVEWSEARQETLKRFLDNQVDTVHFYFHHDPLPPESAYASMGLVKDYKNGLMRKLNEKCHTSRICLHSDFYTTAKKLSLLQYPEPAMVLRFNFFLAICLAHEISHFCEVSGPHHDHPLLSEPEVFFGENMWTESGIAFELKIFGGRIHPLSSRIDCNFGLACLDYPLKELYDKDDNILYALPMDYILKFQQKETWEQDFSKSGNDVFFVPRTGGRSFEINGTNLMIWEDESDADISDHVDGQDTEWKRMDDGSIAKNPNSNNRRPQRQPTIPRWGPYNHKRKTTVEVEPGVAEGVVGEAEGQSSAHRPEDEKETVQSATTEVTEETKAILPDQDMN
ncbi:Eukaryotic translation initiation factor 3 subunit H [Pleosporales sp. CAS-2024a]